MFGCILLSSFSLSDSSASLYNSCVHTLPCMGGTNSMGPSHPCTQHAFATYPYPHLFLLPSFLLQHCVCGAFCMCCCCAFSLLHTPLLHTPLPPTKRQKRGRQEQDKTFYFYACADETGLGALRRAAAAPAAILCCFLSSRHFHWRAVAGQILFGRGDGRHAFVLSQTSTLPT